MPMSPPETERRLVRNTSDIDSIYPLPAGIDGRLDNVDGEVTGILRRLG
jgi:hypothetical protein